MNKRHFQNRCFLYTQKLLACTLLLLMAVSGLGSFDVLLPKVEAAGDLLTQAHYHFRADDGSESAASSLSGSTEDTPIAGTSQQDTFRLRLAISNEGTLTSSSTAFLLEYGTKITACSDIASWTAVDAQGSAFAMFDSDFITDGADTSNISEGDGGVSDENTTFKTPNAAVKDTSSQIASTTIAATEFLEAEFSMTQTANAAYDTTYCFRVSASGTPLPSYTTYPELTTASERDFVVQRGTLTISGTSGTITAGVDYAAPAATSSAFIRITNSHHTGAGDNDGGSQRADDVTAVISNPQNLLSSVTFTRAATALDNTHVSWEIVEFVGLPGSDNEMIVRDQKTVTYGTTELSATGTAAISSITDDADVVVFITGQQNPDTTSSDFNTGQSIASWSASTDEPVFERGEANGDAGIVSYAVVEFTGANWKIQRSEHTYTQTGVTETEPITSVNSLNRTFIHTQKLVGNGLFGQDEFGHEVWLSSIGAVSFLLQEGATAPETQTSVAWVIENMQSTSGAMLVTRSNGSTLDGPEPLTLSVAIGTVLEDMSNASIFANTKTTGIGTTYPRPIGGFTLASTTHYEIWRSDTGTVLDYRVEVVEWPTSQLSIRQNDYRLYVDTDGIDPSDPWPLGATDLGENTVLTETDEPLKDQEIIRMRISLAIETATFPRESKSFKLQYAQRVSTCSAVDEINWSDVGAADSAAPWRGHDAASVADGVPLSTDPATVGDLNLSVSDAAGTYEEENNSAINPYAVALGDDVEYDWVVQQNGAVSGTFYCFRMVEQNGDPLDSYSDYPQLRTANFTPLTQNWQWFDDEGSETPTVSLGAENTAPINIGADDNIKLRITVKEISNMARDDARFKLQYSEYANFSSVTDVEATSSCTGASAWCYFDGGGVDNAVVSATVLTDADACSLGAGNGCGTHNESPLPSSGFRHQNNAATEYEFTLAAVAPRPSAVYYFRLFDIESDMPVGINTGESYPSLVANGASLVFTLEGMSSGTTTENVVIDATSTPNAISFGSIPFDAEYEAAHRLTISTNATEGYQVLMYSDQELLNALGASIDPVLGTNSSPLGWSSSCDAQAQGCFGYHTGDDLLYGGSARFGAFDSYAAFSTTPQEVMYSSIPADESHDIVYKLRVTQEQPSGNYETNVAFIAIPVF